MVRKSLTHPSFAGDLPPQRLNLARYCLEAATTHDGGKTALVVVHDATRKPAHWTYADISELVLRMAEGFRRLGLEPGSRVQLRMGNSFDYALTFFAANAAGLVPIPASAQLSVAEAAYVLSDSGAAAMVADGSLTVPDLPDSCRLLTLDDVAVLKKSPIGEYADTAADGPGYLVYTSGTSGRPKGVLHGQRAVWGRRPMYASWYGLGRDDRLLHTGAFNWTYTLGTGLFDPWANGATTIAYTGARDPAVWPRLVRDHGATIFAAVPGLYRQMLKYAELTPAALAPLRHGLTAGEAMSPALLAEWREATGLTLYEALGMTEISTYISSAPGLPVKPGSPGRPQPGRALALLSVEGGDAPVDIGQSGLIAVHRSDPGMMLGYWNDPEGTEAAYRGDWFLGGDLGRMDEDGYIWFEGRQDDLMNAFGYRVAPQEVENALASHPSVAEVGVAERAVRDDIRVIAAYIVPASGATCDIEALKAHAAERLADYKRPREYLIVGHLPRTPNGKVMRRRLSELSQEAP